MSSLIDRLPPADVIKLIIMNGIHGIKTPSKFQSTAFFIGYGGKTPKSDVGKLITVFYALFGFSLIGMLIQMASSLIKASLHQHHNLGFLQKKLNFNFKSHESAKRFKRLIYMFLVVFVYIIIPSIFFYVIENLLLGGQDWTIMTCFYFVIITLSTIGFGDYVPTLEHNHLPYLFVVLYQIIIFIWILAGLVTMKIWLEMITESMKTVYRESTVAVRTQIEKQQQSEVQTMSNIIGMMKSETNMGVHFKMSSSRASKVDRTSKLSARSGRRDSLILTGKKGGTEQLLDDAEAKKNLTNSFFMPSLQLRPDRISNNLTTCKMNRNRSDSVFEPPTSSPRPSRIKNLPKLSERSNIGFNPPESPIVSNCESSKSSCYVNMLNSSLDTVCLNHSRGHLNSTVYETPRISFLDMSLL